MRSHPKRMRPSTSAIRALGATCTFGSVAAFIVATLAYLSGAEIAVLLHMASLGVFTFGIGALSVARDRDAADANRAPATDAGQQIR